MGESMFQSSRTGCTKVHQAVLPRTGENHCGFDEGDSGRFRQEGQLIELLWIINLCRKNFYGVHLPHPARWPATLSGAI